MRVFFSWSGDRSKAVAAAFRDWLPDVVNAVKPWMSDYDIDKGAIGLDEIANQLSENSLGIVFITNDNQHSTWLNYEAGALSKSVTEGVSRVWTLLVDANNQANLAGPLARFQWTKLNLADVTKLVLAIEKLTDEPREAAKVKRVVEKFWPDLNESVNNALASFQTGIGISKRSDSEKLDEILELMRSELRGGMGIGPDTLRVFNPAYVESGGFVRPTWDERTATHQNQYRDAVFEAFEKRFPKRILRGLDVIWSGDLPVIMIPRGAKDAIGDAHYSDIAAELEGRAKRGPRFVVPTAG